MANASSDIQALFKDVYGDLVDLIPKTGKIQANSKFISSAKENGNTFSFPILSSLENSITLGAPDNGLFTLEPVSGMNTKRVSVKGSSVCIRGAIDNESLSRSSNDRKAFLKGTKILVDSLMKSGTELMETFLLYGGTDIGEVESSTNVSTTKTTLTMVPGSFAAGIFQGRKGLALEFYNLAGTTQIASTQEVYIDSVDSANYKITVTGSTGTIAAIDTYLGSTNCKIYIKNAHSASMLGFDRLITATTGTIFGVDVATEDMWRGNVYPVGGALTYAKLMEALSLPIDRGLNEDVDVYVPTKAWMKLMVDQAALRRYDANYTTKEFKNGAKAISFEGPNGNVNIHLHTMVKQSEIFIIPSGCVKRPGSTDWSFDYSGSGEDFFFPIHNMNGQEVRLFTNQAVVIEKPSYACKLTGITY